MFYKLSSQSSLTILEKEFGVSFKYPLLYKSHVVINGFKEATVPVITSESPNCIDFSIWGLLPVTFEDNWLVFQNILNTLNTDFKHLLMKKHLYSEVFKIKRCLILVTGFYTTFLNEGKIEVYHIHRKNKQPFCIAGVYNELSDGFKTCSLIVSAVNDSENNSIPSFSNTKPFIIKPKDYDYWLDESNCLSDLSYLQHTNNSYHFESDLVDLEIYKTYNIPGLYENEDLEYY